jgi:dTDP-4-dehydrorhamnose reductase
VLEVWRAAEAVRARGADVRGVTLWSLVGARGWDALLTEPPGRYEVGVFDAADGLPRPTAVAQLARELAAGREPSHPVLDSPGWWRRPERLIHPPQRAGIQRGPWRGPATPRPLRLACDGKERDALARACDRRGLAYVHAAPRDGVEPWGALAVGPDEDPDLALDALIDTFAAAPSP